MGRTGKSLLCAAKRQSARKSRGRPCLPAATGPCVGSKHGQPALALDRSRSAPSHRRDRRLSGPPWLRRRRTVIGAVGCQTPLKPTMGVRSPSGPTSTAAGRHGSRGAPGETRPGGPPHPSSNGRPAGGREASETKPKMLKRLRLCSPLLIRRFLVRVQVGEPLPNPAIPTFRNSAPPPQEGGVFRRSGPRPGRDATARPIPCG